MAQWLISVNKEECCVIQVGEWPWRSSSQPPRLSLLEKGWKATVGDQI